MAEEQQLTQAEVLAQLKVRGFESGFQRSPLRHFKGRLMSIIGHMVSFGNTGSTPALEILYNFNEVEVLVSTESLHRGGTNPSWFTMVRTY